MIPSYISTLEKSCFQEVTDYTWSHPGRWLMLFGIIGHDTLTSFTSWKVDHARQDLVCGNRKPWFARLWSDCYTEGFSVDWGQVDFHSSNVQQRWATCTTERITALLYPTSSPDMPDQILRFSYFTKYRITGCQSRLLVFRKYLW